jgi:hypothetical protein
MVCLLLLQHPHPGGAAGAVPAARCWSARRCGGRHPGRPGGPSCAGPARRRRGPRRPRGPACRWRGPAGPAGPLQRGTPAGRADECVVRGLLSGDRPSPASRWPPNRVNFRRPRPARPARWAAQQMVDQRDGQQFAVGAGRGRAWPDGRAAGRPGLSAVTAGMLAGRACPRGAPHRRRAAGVAVATRRQSCRTASRCTKRSLNTPVRVAVPPRSLQPGAGTSRMPGGASTSTSRAAGLTNGCGSATSS